MNLGDHVGDQLAHVQANRQRLQHVLGTRPVFLRQVHGVENTVLTQDTPDGHVADACIALAPGVACTIMVADCLPILMCDVQGQWVAAAHAGWRGLAGRDGLGIIENLLRSEPVAGTDPRDILVWLGPCIGPTAFEVGPDVQAAFEERMPESAGCFQASAPGKWLANLPELARLRLGLSGVRQVFGNDGTPAWCTVTQASNFFSHRRDTRVLGQTGRMAACIWLEGSGQGRGPLGPSA
jgi:YfiH family protein